MFYNNIDPVLISLGPLEIRYYGIVYVLGFLFAWFVLEHFRKKGRVDLTSDEIAELMLYIVLGVILGSRIFHILFWNPMYYLNNPLMVFAFWHGGMAFHGGLVGVLFAAWLYCKKKKINMWRIADILSVPALIALAFGRLANYTNSELYGPVTDASWCVMFNNVEGCRHPYQIYSFLKRMAIAGLLAYTMSVRKFKDGFIFWSMVVLVNIGRFSIDFWREDARLWGLAAGQYISIAVVLVGLFILLEYYYDDVKRLFIHRR